MPCFLKTILFKTEESLIMGLGEFGVYYWQSSIILEKYNSFFQKQESQERKGLEIKEGKAVVIRKEFAVDEINNKKIYEGLVK